MPVLRELLRIGAGTAIVVREGDVVGVRSAESIEELLERAGSLCGRRGWTLLLTSGSAAAVGPETIALLARRGGRCLALCGPGVGPAGADLGRAAEVADRSGVAIVAVDHDGPP